MKAGHGFPVRCAVAPGGAPIPLSIAWDRRSYSSNWPGPFAARIAGAAQKGPARRHAALGNAVHHGLGAERASHRRLDRCGNCARRCCAPVRRRSAVACLPTGRAVTDQLEQSRPVDQADVAAIGEPSRLFGETSRRHHKAASRAPCGHESSFAAGLSAQHSVAHALRSPGCCPILDEHELAPRLEGADGVIVLHWTLVLTAALGYFIVRVRNGPAYVADAYPFPDDNGAPKTRP